jgi:hypothetical protein
MTVAETTASALCILAKHETIENVHLTSQFNGYVCSDALRAEVNKEL